jgi:hypothetical protein
MTINFVDQTANTTQTGTTTVTIPYVGVAAGRLAFLRVVVRPNGATFNTVTGWTQFINTSGGAHASGVGTLNNGNTRLAVWYKFLTGAESGDVTVTLSGGGDATNGSIVAGMTVYSTDLTSFGTISSAIGTDNTHGIDRSVVCAAWSGSGIFPGDKLLLIWAADAPASISSRAITQSGITFGTVSARATINCTGGHDSGVHTADVSVTAGQNSNAPTISFITATTQCGPAAVIAFREVNAGTIAVTEGDDTPAISGTVTPPAFTGTIAVTEENDTGSAAGTVTPPSFVGTIAVTEQDDTCSATGTFVPPEYVGTIAVTEQPDIMDGAGTVAPPAFVGTIAVTEADDIAVITGSFELLYTGTIAVIEQDDLMAAAGVVTQPPMDITVLVGPSRVADIVGPTRIGSVLVAASSTDRVRAHDNRIAGTAVTVAGSRNDQVSVAGSRNDGVGMGNSRAGSVTVGPSREDRGE